jgi:hypothetical protein
MLIEANPFEEVALCNMRKQEPERLMKGVAGLHGLNRLLGFSHNRSEMSSMTDQLCGAQVA